MKKITYLLVPMMLAGLLAGCDNKPTGDPDFTYKNGLIDFGEDFTEKYYPSTDKIDQTLSGKITIGLVFDGKESGWEAVANEYQRLHNNSVIVSLNKNYDSETYPNQVKNVLTTSSGNPEWNIIQGNLLGGLDKTAYTVSFAKDRYADNPYAGNKSWNSILASGAFSSDNNYILNSENLQTAWFVNTVALEAASNNGYSKEVGGQPANPETWNELIELCEAMQEAGYTYPLGLSLDKDSISNSQFSWLLRVYGDYYYRNEYTKITETNYGTYEVDVTSSDPEEGFAYDPTRLFNLILDSDSNSNYVGALSDKFAEFVNQFKKISKFINPFAISQKFKDVRDKFSTQSATNTLASPQILLDYVGSGLGFVDSEHFKVDFFDNPTMISDGKYINDDTLLRDVGGNGGYLSVARHTNNENVDKIAMDFLKFFMSPYGQSIYYAKLAKTNLYPQGITLVKNNLVIIPSNWKQFFQSSKVSFSGQSDTNPFVSFLIRFMSTGGEETSRTAPSLWGSLLTDDTKEVYEDFQKPWDNALFSDWQDYADSQNYNVDCYKHPGTDPKTQSYED